MKIEGSGRCEWCLKSCSDEALRSTLKSSIVAVASLMRLQIDIGAAEYNGMTSSRRFIGVVLPVAGIFSFLLKIACDPCITVCHCTTR